MFPRVFQEFSKSFPLISDISKFAKSFGKSVVARAYIGAHAHMHMEKSFGKDVANLETCVIITKHLESIWNIFGNSWNFVPLCK